MQERVIISGFGGQGVLSAGLMLAESGVKMGYESTYYPSYGAEMRGGTANCQVIISDQTIGSPVITTADTLIALNEPSLEKFLPRVKENGLVIVNSSNVKRHFDYGNRIVYLIPIEEIALKRLGNPKVANIITVGFYARKKNIFNVRNIKRAILEKFFNKGKKVIKLNYQALEVGMEA